MQDIRRNAQILKLCPLKRDKVCYRKWVKASDNKENPLPFGWLLYVKKRLRRLKQA